MHSSLQHVLMSAQILMVVVAQKWNFETYIVVHQFGSVFRDVQLLQGKQI
jgi:hypothetical protein